MAQRKTSRKKAVSEPPVSKIWRVLRPVAVYLTSFIIVIGILWTAWSFVNDRYLQPVDRDDSSTKRIVINYGATVRTIASKLYDEGLIRNKGVFQYMSEFLGQNSKLKAGSYDLSPSMTVAEIIDALTMGDGGQTTMRFRVIEGMTVEQMAASLVEQGALKSADRFLELCRTGEAFRDLPFIEDALKNAPKGAIYALEGFLFPDTYEIYTGETEEVIIRKLLVRCYDVYSAVVAESENEELSMRDAFTLASIIEKEAKTADFAKVSAVFHKRIETGMRLESDVPVKYVLGITRLALTSDDISVDSPYNVYKVGGFPPTPVSNPGRAALVAALNPDSTFMEEGYLFFCTRNPESGELQFSKTLEEHTAAAAQYRPLWEEYDRQQAEKAKATATPAASSSPTPTGGTQQ